MKLNEILLYPIEELENKSIENISKEQLEIALKNDNYSDSDKEKINILIKRKEFHSDMDYLIDFVRNFDESEFE